MKWKRKEECYFWRDNSCQFPNDSNKCKLFCVFFLRGTDRIKDDIDMIQFVVNKALAKIMLYICLVSLLISTISLFICILTLFLK